MNPSLLGPRSSFRTFVFTFLIAIALCPLAPPAMAQMSNVTNTTATPIPGVGHDYIQMLTETVNPANGSVSLRIAVPIPPARQLQVPFAFAYNSAGVHFLTDTSPGIIQWFNAFDSQFPNVFTGGWSFSVLCTIKRLAWRMVDDNTSVTTRLTTSLRIHLEQGMLSAYFAM